MIFSEKKIEVPDLVFSLLLVIKIWLLQTYFILKIFRDGT
jgi:hypothetical protein